MAKFICIIQHVLWNLIISRYRLLFYGNALTLIFTRYQLFVRKFDLFSHGTLGITQILPLTNFRCLVYNLLLLINLFLVLWFLGTKCLHQLLWLTPNLKQESFPYSTRIHSGLMSSYFCDDTAWLIEKIWQVLQSW